MTDIDKEIRKWFKINDMDSKTSVIGSRKDLANFFRIVGYKYGAEIGVCEGRFSYCLFRSIPGLKLICVDPWSSYFIGKGGDAFASQYCDSYS